jgi:hypothetical protein
VVAAAMATVASAVAASAAANLTAASMALALAPPSTMVAASGFGPGQVVRGGHDNDFGHHRYGFYPYSDYYGYAYYPYDSYDDSYYDNGSCYVVNQRVRTAHGWRTRPGVRLIIRCRQFPRMQIRWTSDCWPQRGSAR